MLAMFERTNKYIAIAFRVVVILNLILSEGAEEAVIDMAAPS